jgi:hypothetical protein
MLRLPNRNGAQKSVVGYCVSVVSTAPMFDELSDRYRCFSPRSEMWW